MAAHLLERDAVGAFGEGGELAGVFAGEEILRHDAEEDDGREEAEREGAEHDRAVAEAPAQRAFVGRLHHGEAGFAPAVEGAAGSAAILVRWADEAAAQHGRQRHRDDAGNDDGDHDGDGEFVQQPPDDAAHEEHGDEHGGERGGHGENGEADFLRADERGLIGRVALLHMAHDVFQHDDGIVDDEAHAERQRHE